MGTSRDVLRYSRRREHTPTGKETTLDGQLSEPKKRRRDVGDDGISWDKTNKVWVGTISLGFDSDGKRDRRTVRGKTKTEVKDKLDKLHDEINAGIRTPATYTIELCVADWLDSIERDPHTMATLRGQAKNWIYPRIGKAKLKEFTRDRRRRVLQGDSPSTSASARS